MSDDEWLRSRALKALLHERRPRWNEKHLIPGLKAGLIRARAEVAIVAPRGRAWNPQRLTDWEIPADVWNADQYVTDFSLDRDEYTTRRRHPRFEKIECINLYFERSSLLHFADIEEPSSPENASDDFNPERVPAEESLIWAQRLQKLAWWDWVEAVHWASYRRIEVVSKMRAFREALARDGRDITDGYLIPIIGNGEAQSAAEAELYTLLQASPPGGLRSQGRGKDGELRSIEPGEWHGAKVWLLEGIFMGSRHSPHAKRFTDLLFNREDLQRLFPAADPESEITETIEVAISPTALQPTDATGALKTAIPKKRGGRPPAKGWPIFAAALAVWVHRRNDMAEDIARIGSDQLLGEIDNILSAEWGVEDLARSTFQPGVQEFLERIRIEADNSV